MNTVKKDGLNIPTAVVLRKMTDELGLLSAVWREKARVIKEKYGSEHPTVVAHVTAAFETCAEEIETLLK